MAKVKGPLFGMSAHGTLGDVITFQDGVAGPRVMIVPKHGDKYSTGQSIVRASYFRVVSQWNALSPASKALYDTLAMAKAMTGYNLYIQMCMLGQVYVPPEEPPEEPPGGEEWHYYTYDGQIAAEDCDCGFMFNGSVWIIQVSAAWNLVGAGSDISATRCGCANRWVNVAIPQGAEVTSAYIQIRANASMSANTVNSKIIGNKDANAAVWTTLEDYKARRGTSVGGADNSRRTTSETLWDAIASWTSGTWYTSPSIANVIQEILNQAGWASGNALALWWDDHDIRGTQVYNTYRTGSGFSEGASLTPKLHIEARKFF
jgi:hypothetical protein